MKKIFGILLGIYFIFAGFLFAQNTVQKIFGKVQEIHPSENSFLVSAIEPASGITKAIQIKVDENTRYYKTIGLSELGVDDFVAVDYIQEEHGDFIAKKVNMLERKPHADSTKQQKKSAPDLML